MLGPDFWKNVNKTDTCWYWTSVRDRHGYALFGGARKRLAHRMAFEDAKGPVPPGLELDHLCSIRDCVRPDHMEAVTHAENCRRGEGWAGRNARKTHCPRGHEYTAENTKLKRGGRICRVCLRAGNTEKCRRRRANRREARLAAGWVPWQRVKDRPAVTSKSHPSVPVAQKNDTPS